MKEYVAQAIRTESQNFYKRERRLIHAALGLSSELAEFLEAAEKEDVVNICEEFGDLLWYLAVIWDAIPYDTPQLVEMEFVEEDLEYFLFKLMVQTGRISNEVKRAVFYQDTCNYEAIFEASKLVLNTLQQMAGTVQLRKIMHSNLEKLRVRYPDKFTAENAINRDLEKEKLTLS